jgi:hypothetical protein
MTAITAMPASGSDGARQQHFSIRAVRVPTMRAYRELEIMLQSSKMRTANRGIGPIIARRGAGENLLAGFSSS